MGAIFWTIKILIEIRACLNFTAENFYRNFEMNFLHHV